MRPGQQLAARDSPAPCPSTNTNGKWPRVLVSWNGKAAAGIWCANRYHHYPAYQAPPDPLLEPFPTDREGITLRGGCLHTQAVLRRTTSRIMGLPEERNLFAGTRLVMPPGRAAWE